MKKKRFLIVITVILVLVVVVAESCLYYSRYMANMVLYVEMVLHNIVRFCLLSPEISIEDATKVLGEESSVMQAV